MKRQRSGRFSSRRREIGRHAALGRVLLVPGFPTSKGGATPSGTAAMAGLPLWKVRRTLAVEVEHASDIDLARQAGSGDELAFEEIVRRYGPRVFRIAGRFFRQRSAVEEISQEVFLRTYT